MRAFANAAFENREPLDDLPIPLFEPTAPTTAYPVHALGPILSAAAQAIANKVQVPPALAAQSVLAAASLAAQALADVMLPTGQTRPLSLSFVIVIVAGSGDRKSSADSEALRPVRRRERALREVHEGEMRDYHVKVAAWEAEKKKIERNIKLDYRHVAPNSSR